MSNALADFRKYNKYNMYCHINRSKSSILTISNPDTYKSLIYICKNKPPRNPYVISYIDDKSGLAAFTNSFGEVYVVQLLEYKKHICSLCKGRGFSTRSTSYRKTELITYSERHDVECVKCNGMRYICSDDDYYPLSDKIIEEIASKLDFCDVIYAYSSKTESFDIAFKKQQKPKIPRRRRPKAQYLELNQSDDTIRVVSELQAS